MNLSENNDKNIKLLLPFDENWDISQIDYQKIGYLITSKYMYTELLKIILKNEINLNVIIDKNSKFGLVYKNENEKYIEIKLSDIITYTMEKLLYHLLEFNKNNINQPEEIIDFSLKMINKKFNDYNKNKYIKEAVDSLMIEIFYERKEESMKFFSKFPQEFNIK